MPIYKDEKNGSWFVVIRYKDLGGKSKMTTKRGFKTKKAAKAYESDFIVNKADDLTITFGEFYKIYHEYISKRLKLSTVLTKDSIYAHSIGPYFENMRMCDIKPSDIIKWQNIIMSKKTKNNTPMSQEYLRTIHGQLSAIFNYAVRFYDLKKNPARTVGNMGKQKKEEMRFWTKEEYLQFSKSMMKKDDMYHAFEMLYWCGIRLGELLALTPSDFDFEKSTVRINKSYQRINREDVITDPKTKKSNRVVQMPSFLNDEMEDYISRLYEIKDGDRIFKISKSKLHHELDRGCKETGIKRIRIHDLRHSHVSLLIDMGFSPVDIANRVGHESVKITFRYAHMFPTRDKDIADKLEVIRN